VELLVAWILAFGARGHRLNSKAINPNLLIGQSDSSTPREGSGEPDRMSGAQGINVE
jgi:hypothetical protein